MAIIPYAEVVLWGRVIAIVQWDDKRSAANFEYVPEFQSSGIEIAPIVMPLSDQVYSFPRINRDTYFGLPGLLADSLPDKFGNLLINQWLVRSGRSPDAFTPIERLCYVGTRGMGGLEFRPAIADEVREDVDLDVAELVQLANEALRHKASLSVSIGSNDEQAADAMRAILSVGTSAGGARAKAVICWNPATNEIRSGQLGAPDGFQHWLLKFDGVSGNRDKELDDPQGYGRVEYAYHLMAVRAGIEMTECRLFEESDRCHFMTRRFDRDDQGGKTMMQSLCAIAHMDFNIAGAHSYEQAIQVAEDLRLTVDERRQLYRRMVFNVVARNQDDHTKNIAFLMDKTGRWSLSPAFDVTYSYNPDGAWTSRHQMTVNGKRTDLQASDLLAVANRFRVIGKQRAKQIIVDVLDAVRLWPEFAGQSGVDSRWIDTIRGHHRLDL